MSLEPLLQFSRVGFSYEASPLTLFTDINLHFPPGWTGIVGPNGAGKTTLLLLACGLLKPGSGSITMPSLTMYCEQRTDRPPLGAEEFMAALDGESQTIKSKLDLNPEDLRRWSTLSHGERKRFQIGAALYARPDLLALDEPTNHLDSISRDLLRQGLKQFRGIGLLVSHDRELLDRLCIQCVFIEPPNVIMRPGNYSDGVEQARIDDAGIKKTREKAEVKLANLRRVQSKRKQAAARSVRLKPKRGLSSKDHDAREKVDRLRVSGRDAARGGLLGQMEGRLKQAGRELEATTFKKEHPTGITVLGGICPRKTIVNLPEGSLALGEESTLVFPELRILPRDRIALVGPNGAGKSTLMNRIYSSLPMPAHLVTYIPQEIPLDASRRLLRDLRTVPKDQRGWLMNIISRLGSRPERLLESDHPSPGETRKILLALGLLKEPWLVMMDEPTNHLDLFSMECLETGLADFQGGLLLVSHDQRFLEKLTEIQWEIRPKNGLGKDYVLHRP